ncbi:STAS domain-containing protein [Longispora sp. NPDC051575]|uniref:STAS domain-containing protein n=1 Tax=Longispora sp. NPDC051575 TaxID=3154943 RepID=UPI0034156BD1
MTEHGPVSVVTVCGEIDVATAPTLQRRLAALYESDQLRLVVDLSGVTFCDSVGVSVLIGAARALSGRGRVHLVGLRPVLERLFEVTGIGSVFVIHPGLSTAIDAAGTFVPGR